MSQPLINIPRGPFVDVKTGLVTLEWRLWLQNPHVISIILNDALSVSSGGTGNSTSLTDGQLLIGSTASPEALIPNTLTAVNHQTKITNGSGSITIGTVQDIDTSSSPTFTDLTLTGNETVDGNIGVTGNVGIGGTLGVTGDSNLSRALLNSPVDDGNTLQVNGALTVAHAAYLIKSAVSLTDGAGASLGTLTNAPAAGNPTKWIGINDNGTTRYIPAW